MSVDAKCYRHLLGKLIYLTATHLDVTYSFSVLVQFMQELHMVHLEGALQFLCTSSMPLEKGLYFDAMIIFPLRPILLLDMLGTKETKNLLRGIVHI